ncbi:hypothetical protein HED60_19125 [Planctomycetales bacterium ZRK34]|nr:hypothetical protein HED60_19125 [Planctomycetales bacterium ZRK34]
MSVEQYDENLLLGYVEGELTADETARVEAWAAEDTRLAGLLASMQADRKALAAMPDPPTPEWLMDEVDRQLERAMLVDMGPQQFADTSIAQRHIMRRIVLGTAVAAMLMVVAGVVISSLTGVSESPHFAMNGEPKPTETDVTMTDAEDATLPDVPAVAETVPSEQPAEPAVVMTEPGKAAESAEPVEPVKGSTTEPAVPNAPMIAKGDNTAGGSEAEPVKPDAETAEPSPAVAAKPDVAEPADTDKPMTEPATPGPGQMLAGSGAPRHADLLPQPPEAPKSAKAPPEARLPADDALYNARQIRLQPDLAQQMELLVVAGDPDKVVQQVTAFMSGAAKGDAPKQSLTKTDLQQAVSQILKQAEPTPSQRYVLKVDTEQLPRLIAELQAASGNAQVQLRKRNLLAVGNVPDKAPLKPDVTLTPAPWPTLAPDYRAILQQQIPQTPRKNQPDTSLVDLPLIIQQTADKSDR